MSVTNDRTRHLTSYRGCAILLDSDCLAFCGRRKNRTTHCADPASGTLVQRTNGCILLTRRRKQRIRLFAHSNSIMRVRARRAVLSTTIGTGNRYTILASNPRNCTIRMAICSHGNGILCSHDHGRVTARITLTTGNRRITLVDLRTTRNDLGSAVRIFSLGSSTRRTGYACAASSILLCQLRCLTSS